MKTSSDLSRGWTRTRSSTALSIRRTRSASGGGSALAYGAGCKGSGNYTPTSIAAGPVSHGSSSSFALGGAVGGKPVILLLGAQPAELDLTHAGAPGCFLRVMPLLSLATVTSGTGHGHGVARIGPFLLPPQTAVNTQWVTLDTANQLGLVFSDGRLLKT